MENIDTSQALLSFFGLRRQPFAATADPMYFYATREHKECLFRLWNSIDERNGIAVILGHYGTGKTTLLRKALTGMRSKPERYNVAVIGSPIPSWTSFSLLEAIVSQFGLQPEPRSFVAYMEALNRYLLNHHQRINTLIIDDAQNLNKRGQLELLRLVQNLETPHHKLLNLVFFAQMEWLDVLRAAPNFAQRVNMSFTLGPLSLAETRGLIDFRLRQAGAVGGQAPVFDDGAVKTIYAYAHGSPRETVTVCRNALLLAAHIRSRQIGQAVILHTIQKTTLPDPERHSRISEALEEAEEPQPRPVGLEPESEDEGIGPRQQPQSMLQQRANQLLLNAEGNRGSIFSEEP
ncbi:MAG: AAA family ATPase [Candidatus Hydrogenedentota bacterium]